MFTHISIINYTFDTCLCVLFFIIIINDLIASLSLKDLCYLTIKRMLRRYASSKGHSVDNSINRIAGCVCP